MGGGPRDGGGWAAGPGPGWLVWARGWRLGQAGRVGPLGGGGREFSLLSLTHPHPLSAPSPPPPSCLALSRLSRSLPRHFFTLGSTRIRSTRIRSTRIRSTRIRSTTSGRQGGTDGKRPRRPAESHARFHSPPPPGAETGPTGGPRPGRAGGPGIRDRGVQGGVVEGRTGRGTRKRGGGVARRQGLFALDRPDCAHVGDDLLRLACVRVCVSE